MRFFNTFRGRLLLILAFLLVLTLGVQYYLNILNEGENSRLREMQEASVVAGFSVGMSSLTSENYRVQDLAAQGQAYFDEADRRRIKDILIIDNELHITDSLSDDYLPVQNDDGSVTYKYLPELTDLPPLMQRRPATPLHRRNQRSDQLPLSVGQVGWISASTGHGSHPGIEGTTPPLAVDLPSRAFQTPSNQTELVELRS